MVERRGVGERGEGGENETGTRESKWEAQGVGERGKGR